MQVLKETTILSANAFCPTGIGGGRDPTCGSGGGSSGGGGYKSPDERIRSGAIKAMKKILRKEAQKDYNRAASQVPSAKKPRLSPKQHEAAAKSILASKATQITLRVRGTTPDSYEIVAESSRSRKPLAKPVKGNIHDAVKIMDSLSQQSGQSVSVKVIPDSPGAGGSFGHY